MNLSLAFFHRTSTGDLMSRITSDTGTLQTTISNSLAVLIKEPITVAGLAALLISQQPRLTLIALVVFPLCIVPILVYARKARQASAAIQQYWAELSTVIHEAFTGNRIIKAYNLEGAVEQQFRSTARKFISHYMRLVRSLEVPGPLIEFVGALGVALLFFAVVLSPRTPMSAGDFFLFVGSIFMLYAPIKALTRLYQQFEQARAATERVFELLGTPTTVIEPATPLPLCAANADIHFDGVTFSYGDKVVLNEIQLTVKPGQIIALVGSSGAGKTTLTNLLLRFYDPQCGAVRIGNVDIRQVSSRDLRNQIAVVTQETILFNDTVRHNIGLGRPGATEAEIVAAAKHAFAHDFIMEKPQGYDTVIGEKGVTLSGGQRQRLAIARAILKNAPILVLDEATSALDTESERAIQAALEELMTGRTTVCIAHRLSTVQKADVIVVLDQGQIVEMGRHAELIQQEGTYYKLHQMQFSS
jgi:subfamily B ATP-binding cassette protein MsbA